MIRYFLFSFFVFFTKNLLATDYSFHEKVSGEAFSTFSEGESSYLYNPSIKGTEAHHFILPLGLEFFGNDYLIKVLSQKMKSLKGSEEEIVKFLRESNKKDLTARLRTSTAYMNQSIVVAFHTKMEFETELRDSYLGGEELEFYSGLDFNLTFSYNRPFLKYFGAGVSATTRYSLDNYLKESALTIADKKIKSYNLSHGQKKFELKLDLGLHSDFPMTEKHHLIAGLTFNDFVIPLGSPANKLELIENDPSFMRFGVGVEAHYVFLKLKPAFMYMHEIQVLNPREYNPSHFGFRMRALDMFKLSFGLSDFKPSYGISYYNGFFALGYGGFFDREEQVLNNSNFLQKHALYFRLSLSF